TARGLLRFDTSAIPRDALVTEAKVGLDFAAGTATTVEAHGATKPWTNAATWNSYDGTNPWTSPGGDAGPVQDTATVGAAAGWTYWYVSALAQQWVNSPSANNGLLLDLLGEQQSPLVTRVANSMEAADQSTWPYMDVT